MTKENTKSVTKALIFDSGTLINLSMNGLLPILENLKKQFNGKFLITKAVKYETVDRPIGIYRFELGALRVNNLIEKGILEMSSSIGISDEELAKETARLMEIANTTVSARGTAVKIVSEAEISCLALSSKLAENGIESIIAIDERTTRILGEKGGNLGKLMSDRLHLRIEVDENKLEEFSKFRFIRSSELVYVAYKKGLLEIEGKKALEAALYATKFHGAAISFEEIDILKKM